MQKFCPLFTLRYSATHRAEYNKIYRLDAVDAYNRQLVKKIQVKGISLKGSTGTTGYLYPEQIVISSGKPPYVLIEYEKRSGDGVKKVRGRLERGANLFELSGGIPAYQHHTVTEIDAYRNMITVNGRDIYAGDIQGAVDEGTFRRIQIREAIASHLQKERQLFERGIKVLSLFFIDSVEKYRVYDESGEAAAGEYARIFEEEYSNLRNDCLELFQSESDDCQPGTDAGKRTKYSDYLWRDDASRVHEGYFSVDRKGKMTDPAVKGKSEDSDDISAYELIMKDKERLLSFEEPVRFIFSHSALKEGWDNPNVFQICALKNPEAGSSTRRRQEVGRGMRLCVDARGIRQDFELLGEQVHEINKLTVIASESYEAFARGLQDEIAVTLQSRPQRANTEFFIGKLVMDETGVQRRLTKDDARKLQVKLIVNQVIDEDYKITDTGREQIERNSIEVPLHLEPYRESIAELLRSIYSGEPPKPEDERQTITLNTNGNFRKREFQELWDRISLKTVYEVKIDVEKLFVESRNRINARLNVSEQHYEIRTGEMKSGTVEEMRAGDLIRESERENLTVKADLPARTAYDMIGEIEARTHLTRNTIVRILKSIHVEKFIMMRRNPEEFIAKCSKLINEAKASLIFDGIVYHKTEERYDAKTVFTNDKLVLRNSEMLKKHVYDYLTTDSKIESEFAQALENSVEVVVYAKLPKSFHITTPVANYSPDWAIVFDKDRVRHIYFVAETKGSESDMDLREIEKLKIHCAEKHFDAIGGGTVKFSKIKTYNGLLELIQ
jgi:type III restriction enzyme